MALLPFAATRIIGSAIGNIAWLSGSSAAKVTLINLRHCYPAMRENERNQLAKRSLVHTGRLLAETGITFRWSPEKLKSLVKEVEGTELAESSLAVKRGVLVLVPHFGNWDMLALQMGYFGFSALYDPPRVEAFDRLLKQARQRTGATLVPIDVQGLRAVYQSLKKGKAVGILPDQVPTRSAGVYAPFFRRTALTMTFVHRLVQSAEPLVLIGWCRRLDDGFKITLKEVDSAIHAKDQLESVTAMNRAIEGVISEDPAQYQWEYKRFKKSQPGSPKLYDE